jgi:hypothetical protein
MNEELVACRYCRTADERKGTNAFVPIAVPALRVLCRHRGSFVFWLRRILGLRQQPRASKREAESDD